VTTALAYYRREWKSFITLVPACTAPHPDFGQWRDQSGYLERQISGLYYKCLWS